MSAQPKLLRVLNLVQLLHHKPYKNLKQLSACLEVNQRTVYRYLITLEELGYLIDKTFEGQFFLFTDTDAQAEENLTLQEFQVLDQLFNLFYANQHVFESCRQKLARKASSQRLSCGLR